MINTGYKVTSFFQDDEATPNSGWSESFYMAALSDDALKTYYKSYLSARLGCSGPACEWLGARVRNFAAPRKDILYDAANLSLTLSQTLGSYTPTASGASRANMPPDNAILLRLETTDHSKSHSFMHGVPIAVLSGAGQYSPDSAFESALLALFTLMFTPDGKWVIWDSTISAPSPVQTVSDVRITNRKTGRPAFEQAGRARG